MANNYCQASFIIECSEKEADEFLRIAEAYNKAWEINNDDSGEPLCAQIEKDTDGLWIADDGEYINVDGIGNLIQEWMKLVGRDKPVGFEWAVTCSKPRVGEFGGGAMVITQDEIKWVNTGVWLYETTKTQEGNPAKCEACHRESLVCSADPCDAVLADRSD